MVIIYFR